MFGARVFTALRTSKFIKVSSEEVDVVGCSDVVDGLTGDSLEGMAWGAAGSILSSSDIIVVFFKKFAMCCKYLNSISKVFLLSCK